MATTLIEWAVGNTPTQALSEAFWWVLGWVMVLSVISFPFIVSALIAFYAYKFWGRK